MPLDDQGWRSAAVAHPRTQAEIAATFDPPADGHAAPAPAVGVGRDVRADRRPLAAAMHELARREGAVDPVAE
jgi:hypothetical protein